MTYRVADPTTDPNFQPEIQGCGYTIAIILSIIYLLLGILTLIAVGLSFIYWWHAILTSMSCFLMASFFIRALSEPNFIGGWPIITKMWQLTTANAILILGNIVFAIIKQEFAIGFIGSLVPAIIVAIFESMYAKNDTDPNSSCLCLKPWVYKFRPVGYPYGVPPGYPPYGQVPGYPVQQGFPSYAQAPASRGYPPYGQVLKG